VTGFCQDHEIWPQETITIALSCEAKCLCDMLNRLSVDHESYRQMDRHNRVSILWNSYLEATEEEKELTWARIADIFWTKQARSSDNNVIVIVIHF